MQQSINIKELIRNTGAITIAQYMSTALEEYYKSGDPLGVKGDFITAPEISQIFGELVGIWLATNWTPTKKDIALVELGAGRGTMMSDILRATRKIPDFQQNMSIHIVEINKDLREIQRKTLDGIDVHWHESIDSIPEIPTLFIANEFFDALPIHQLIKTKNGWREKTVDLDKNNNLKFSLSASETPITALIPKHIKNLKESSVYEICPSAINIIRTISKHIMNNGGLALIIDYGYFHNPFIDTFQAVKNNKYHNPLENTGEADLTALVNFIRLEDEAKKIGVVTYGNITQGEFLKDMGIDIRAEVLMQNADKQTRKKIIDDVKRLTDPEQMGSLFKCLALMH